MSDQDDPAPPKTTVKSAFHSGQDPDKKPAFFKPEEMDIYVNKITLEAFIFHSRKLEHDIDRLEYDPEDHSVTVVKKDGSEYDLGVKIEWLIRHYFTRAQEVGIVQTKDGETIDGFFVPLIHKVRS